MSKLGWAITLTALLLLSAFSFAAAQTGVAEGEQSEHDRKGLEYYNDAFYNRLPKGMKREADRAFELAAEEFQKAIDADPQNAEATRHLARLYYVQEEFPQAADAYRQLTILLPRNLDAHVQLALCYIKLDRFADAVRELEIAKTVTDSPEAIGKLDGYIRKITDREQLNRKEAGGLRRWNMDRENADR